MAKCERCDEPAAIHVTEMVEGAPRERHFCEEHSRDSLDDDYRRLVASFSFGEGTPQPSGRLWEALREAGMNRATDFLALDPELAVPAFIKLLSENDPKLRYWGAKLLGRMERSAKAAIPHLRALVHDEDEHVGRVAKEALGRIEGWPEA